MPHWLSHKLLRLLGVVTVTAIVGFLLLPALVVTLAAFNGRAILSFPPETWSGRWFIKAIEYHEHWENHEFPGPHFDFKTISGQPPTDPLHTEIYFSLYWAMTGLHALHMIIGIGLVTWLVIAGLKNTYSPVYYSPVDNVGLYWHFVDLVLIYLFPLLYLISKKHG